jgi:hypothetical protein
MDDGARDGAAATAGEVAEVRRHYVDLLHRLEAVHFAVNYSDAWGQELLERPMVQVALETELIHMQRTPTYLRPASRADAHGLGRWLRAQLGGWAGPRERRATGTDARLCGSRRGHSSDGASRLAAVPLASAVARRRLPLASALCAPLPRHCRPARTHKLTPRCTYATYLHAQTHKVRR